MSNYLLLTETTESGGFPIAAQILIIVLCLISPYLISRYTGKSMAEWLRLDTLLGFLKGKPKKKAPEKKSAADVIRKTSDPNFTEESRARAAQAKKDAAETITTGIKAAPKKTAGKERNSTKGDLSKFIMDLLTFSRKQKLFLLIPGGVQYGNEIASLTAILVTRRCVVGINTFGFGGTIQVRANDATWTQRLNDEQKELKNPTKANEANARILKNALESIGLGDIPVETAEIFTSPTLTLKGGKPRSLYTWNSFFETMKSDAYNKGSIDPKAVGKALDELIPKVKQSRKK